MSALLPTWDELAAARPALVAPMRRYRQQRACSLRPGSVGGVDLALRSFTEFLIQAAPELTTLAGVTRRHIEDYKPWLAARPGRTGGRVTTNTIAHRLGTLRMFFVRLEDWAWPQAPPRVPIVPGDLPRQDKPLPKALDDPAAARFLRDGERAAETLPGRPGTPEDVAAAVIRAIESHEQRLATGRRPRSWRRHVLTVAGVVVFAVVAGVLVAQASGRREAGETLTGDIRESTRMQLADAVQLANAGDYDGAIEAYDEVLDEDPRNAEALAYKGWFLFLDGDAAGLDSLVAAAEADPDFPDTHAFMAIILARSGRPDEALAALDRLDALDPPAGITELVAPIRAQVESQVADGGTAGGSGDAGGSSPSTG